MGADKIRSRRKGLGLTQEFVAERLGLSQKAYSDIESGKTKLKTDVLTRISEILAVSPFTLCPIGCDCQVELVVKHQNLVQYLLDNKIDFPAELI